MAQELVALFPTHDAAQQAADALATRGFDRGSISLTENDSTKKYEGGKLGGTLLSITFDEARENDVRMLLEEHQATGIGPNPDTSVKTSGYMQQNDVQKESARSGDERGGKPGQNFVDNGTRTDGDDTILPVIEEQLRIDKRQVESGSVRVSTVVKDVPVEQQVSLREERIRVERRPVDRALTTADLDMVRGGVLELTERSEQAIIHKEARVVEEVVIDREIRERSQTVRDTVRRTDVQIEHHDAKLPVSVAYEDLQKGFEADYSTRYATSGYRYEQYAPAYRYGYTLATGDDTRDWSAIESDARTRWETDHADTPWEKFRDAVQTGWDSVRGKRQTS